jgi:oxalate decarboxylase
MMQDMPATARRRFLGGVALGAATFAAGRTIAAPAGDAHASGYDVAPAGEFMRTVPRKPGDPVTFTFSLDHNPVKATSGGWAREVTTRHLPLASNIAGAHLFMNPGGSREMHWHSTAAEWAYILDGQCQVIVLDPDGLLDVVNCASGDLWFFPKGHAHAISTLGDAPCHAILTFDDGLYSERGTFGLSDWLSRFDAATLARNFAVPAASFAAFPQGETYINQGDVIALDSPAARTVNELPPEKSHCYRLMAAKPLRSFPGGTLHLASAREFPVSASMTGLITRLQPGAMQELHWHPNANEWFYVSKGRARATLFGADKRMAVAELGIGDCGYFPQGWGHSIEAVGTEKCEIVASLDSGTYQDSSLSEWIAKVPPHVLGNNLGAAEVVLAKFPRQKVMIAGGA